MHIHDPATSGLGLEDESCPVRRSTADSHGPPPHTTMTRTRRTSWKVGLKLNLSMAHLHAVKNPLLTVTILLAYQEPPVSEFGCVLWRENVPYLALPWNKTRHFHFPELKTAEDVIHGGSSRTNRKPGPVSLSKTFTCQVCGNFCEKRQNETSYEDTSSHFGQLNPCH